MSEAERLLSGLYERPMPVARWTFYGRWSDDGLTCYVSAPHVAKFALSPVFFDLRRLSWKS